MSVLMVSSYDGRGGAAIAALRLHQGLLRQGVKAEMLVRRKFTDVPGIGLLAPGAWSRIQSILIGIGNRRELRRFGAGNIARHGHMSHVRGRLRPDWKQLLDGVEVVNLHWVSEMFDYGGLFAALNQNQKVVWTLHDMNAFTGTCHYAGSCTKFRDACGACPHTGSLDPADLSAVGLQVKKVAFENLSEGQLAVVTPSHWLREQSSNSRLLGRFDHHVIPYGLDTDLFRPMNRKFVRQQIGIKNRERVLLILSAMLHDWRKGLDLLQQALESNLSNDPICLVAVGAGKVPDTGIRTIKLGELDDPQDLAAAYNSADVFVAPSREDNLPNTVLESLACGTPVVAFDIGGMPDMIEPGVTGMLARPEDPEDLARCISTLLDDPEIDGAMRERCRDMAVSHYSLDRQAKDYLKLFNDLL